MYIYQRIMRNHFNFFFLKIFVYILKIKEYYNPQFQFSKSLKPHGAGDPFLWIRSESNGVNP
ncbi:hypothetical protein CN272_05670 [Bacillus anthracis]|nr:hypothetical protein BK748_29020 [Bacillus thuringiensis serovar graciosensis]PEU95865.1 hypothetical protein CN415_06525 [Bacillus cereus]PFC89195.1 hypothetical protein CN272_05670 [Bacillus anthracis]PFT25267.1 hypothetical protein COK52_06675 [Bacillus thuringiensis]PFE27402.1 hypothetical protein CN279_11205 [Bacillus anthracis]